MSSLAIACPSVPCRHADTSRHAPGHLFRSTVTRFPDGGQRTTLTRCRAGAASRAPYCPLGVQTCAFEYRRVKRAFDGVRRSTTRARGRVVELARCNALDTLVTLTAGAGLATRQEALDALSAFFCDRSHGKWLRELVGPYLAVAEPFEGGGWHLHLAVHGGLDMPALLRLRESWTRFLGHALDLPAPGGFWRVDLRSAKSWETPGGLGAYLAKHVVPEGGKKSYRSALNMVKAIRETVVVALTSAAAWARVALFGEPRPVRHPVWGTVLGWSAERPPREFSGWIGVER